LLEHKGARVGLLTTEGHRDVIEMRKGLKDDRYNLRLPPPEQLVPRKLRLGVRERLRADGKVETPLDPVSLDRAVDALQTVRG
jgi:N-methylhydantoinase A